MNRCDRSDGAVRCARAHTAALRKMRAARFGGGERGPCVDFRFCDRGTMGRLLYAVGFFTETTADQHTERREGWIADLIVDVQPFFAAIEESFAGHQSEMLAHIRLSVACGLDELANRLLTVDLHLIQQLQAYGLAQYFKPLGRPLDLRLRDEFFGHGIELE